MERRDFLKQGTLAAIAGSSSQLPQAWAKPGSPKTYEPIAKRRLGKMDIRLLIPGMSGIVRDFSQISEGRQVQA